MSTETVFWLVAGARVLGWAALNAVWQCALVALASWAALRLLPADATRARSRVAAASVLLALALLVANGVLLGLDWRVHADCWARWSAEARVPGVCAQHGLARDAAVPHTPLDQAPAWGALVLGPAERQPTTGSRALDRARSATPLLGVLALLWAAWTLWLALRGGRAALALRGLRRRSRPPSDARIARSAAELCLTLRVRGPIEVRESADVAGPCLVPGRAPLILFPRGLAVAARELELRAVLAHELAHVRRRDDLVAPIWALALAALPPNPFAGVLARTLREEREADCDRTALAGCGVTPGEYARTLLLLEGFRQSRSDYAAVVPFLEPSTLLGRVRRLVADSSTRRLASARHALALMLLFASALLLGVATTRANAVASWAIMSHDLSIRAPATPPAH